MKNLWENVWFALKFLVLLRSFSEEVGKTLMPMGIKICSSNHPKRYSVEKQAVAKLSIRTRIKTTSSGNKKPHSLAAKSSIRTRIKTLREH